MKVFAFYQCDFETTAGEKVFGVGGQRRKFARD
ncbi:MAG: hypothetical protein QOJ99_902 [Bryobacterales bacterium]|jgi:hypothetical protein|nr:hypothetical protein [Bryobacterales bacterium]